MFKVKRRKGDSLIRNVLYTFPQSTFCVLAYDNLYFTRKGSIKKGIELKLKKLK